MAQSTKEPERYSGWRRLWESTYSSLLHKAGPTLNPDQVFRALPSQLSRFLKSVPENLHVFSLPFLYIGQSFSKTPGRPCSHGARHHLVKARPGSGPSKQHCTPLEIWLETAIDG